MNPNSKWNDPVYHTLETMRELSAAEQHLVQYININDQSNELTLALNAIRNARKKLEDCLYGK